MPADRKRPSWESDLWRTYEETEYPPSPPLLTINSEIAFAPTVTTKSYEEQEFTESPMDTSNSDLELVVLEEQSGTGKSARSRKKPLNHIPRPPNAFILFRSWFVKSRHVSTEVETNHSTLSKIIGLTWQKLSNEERQKWHAEAKLANNQHKRMYPQYSFKPIHTKPRGTASEKKRIREVEHKDEKRCAMIAEFLVHGKKGQELEEAVQEFDKFHVPEIVTRFEEPITANTFSASSSAGSGASSALSRKRSRSSSVASRRASPLLSAPSDLWEAKDTPPLTPTLSFEQQTFFSESPRSFGLATFDFSIDHPPSVSHSANEYAQVTIPKQDTSRLSAAAPFRGMEDWARHGSPLSNSSGSLPSTPMSIPYPELEPYGTFSSESVPKYSPQLDGTFRDYSHYSLYPQTSEPTYVNKDSKFHDPGTFPTSIIHGGPDDHGYTWQQPFSHSRFDL